MFAGHDARETPRCIWRDQRKRSLPRKHTYPYRVSYSEMGKSDFEAYRIVGAQMYQEGKLTQPQQQPVARTASKQQDPVRNTQRKAAATPSSRKQVSVQSEYSPLAMSDEEFLKINNIHI